MKKRLPKMSALVVNAIKNLRENRGSTTKEILKYILTEHKASEPTIQRQMLAALKRGLDYGILKRIRGHYTLNDTLKGANDPKEFLVPMEKCSSRRRRRSRPKRKSRMCRPKSRRGGRSRKGRKRRKSSKSASRRKMKCGSSKSFKSRKRSNRRKRKASKSRCHSSGKEIDVCNLIPFENEELVDTAFAKTEGTRQRSRSRTKSKSSLRNRSVHSNGENCLD